MPAYVSSNPSQYRKTAVPQKYITYIPVSQGSGGPQTGTQGQKVVLLKPLTAAGSPSSPNGQKILAQAVPVQVLPMKQGAANNNSPPPSPAGSPNSQGKPIPASSMPANSLQDIVNMLQQQMASPTPPPSPPKSDSSQGNKGDSSNPSSPPGKKGSSPDSDEAPSEISSGADPDSISPRKMNPKKGSPDDDTSSDNPETSAPSEEKYPSADIQPKRPASKNSKPKGRRPGQPGKKAAGKGRPSKAKKKNVKLIDIGEPLNSQNASEPENEALNAAKNAQPKKVVVDIAPRHVIDQDKLNGFIEKHENNMEIASRARRNFLLAKLNDVKNQEGRDQKKLQNLEKMYKEENDKLSKMQEEIRGIKHNMSNNKNTANNQESAMKNLKDEAKKNDADAHLKEVEIMRLTKKLHVAKSELALTEDKRQMYRNALEKIKKEYETEKKSNSGNSNKLALYRDVITKLEDELRSIKAGMDNVEKSRQMHSEEKNALEMEIMHEEEDRHLPMMIQYA